LGFTLAESLCELFERSAVRSGGVYYTRSDIGKLASSLLDLKQGEVFYDFAAGIGSSTLQITKGVDAEIVHNDISVSTNGLAAMLYIMAGKKHFTITSEDVLAQGYSDVKADKVFIDPPAGLKIERVDGLKQDMQSASLEILLSGALSENGMAVIMCPAGVLFSNAIRIKQVKEKILKTGQLKAVISLPTTYPGSKVTNHMLVISNEHRNDNSVMIIDAVKIKPDTRNTLQKNASLSENDISLISEAVNKGRVIPGVSALVSPGQIEKADYNLTPSLYLVEEVKSMGPSVAEIDREISKLFKEFTAKFS